MIESLHQFPGWLALWAAAVLVLAAWCALVFAVVEALWHPK